MDQKYTVGYYIQSLEIDYDVGIGGRGGGGGGASLVPSHDVGSPLNILQRLHVALRLSVHTKCSKVT